jgi:hypothetical protein
VRWRAGSCGARSSCARRSGAPRRTSGPAGKPAPGGASTGTRTVPVGTRAVPAAATLAVPAARPSTVSVGTTLPGTGLRPGGDPGGDIGRAGPGVPGGAAGTETEARAEGSARRLPGGLSGGSSGSGARRRPRAGCSPDGCLTAGLLAAGLLAAGCHGSPCGQNWADAGVVGLYAPVGLYALPSPLQVGSGAARRPVVSGAARRAVVSGAAQCGAGRPLDGTGLAGRPCDGGSGTACSPRDGGDPFGSGPGGRACPTRGRVDPADGPVTRSIGGQLGGSSDVSRRWPHRGSGPGEPGAERRLCRPVDSSPGGGAGSGTGPGSWRGGLPRAAAKASGPSPPDGSGRMPVSQPSASSWSLSRRDESDDQRLRRGSFPYVMPHRVSDLRAHRGCVHEGPAMGAGDGAGDGGGECRT